MFVGDNLLSAEFQLHRSMTSHKFFNIFAVAKYLECFLISGFDRFDVLNFYFVQRSRSVLYELQFEVLLIRHDCLTRLNDVPEPSNCLRLELLVRSNWECLISRRFSYQKFFLLLLGSALRVAINISRGAHHDKLWALMTATSPKIKLNVFNVDEFVKTVKCHDSCEWLASERKLR